ncbi:MAG: hypothetical protein HOL51_25830 [Gemmatimonadetes bacterium]|jgi:arylsulfatase A-like enzyme|nr:hypothetical protein [Gemmatimonadota bacterium]MBT5448484.1 hypothetical protein [Gemmatimonadota bacterium]MBT6618360.1 hypothetical protein [Gemmatimonadota bacterium]MBT7585122.1 hypothetical protein [Gemmatimonadota bacterium]MBT7770383.1 hypothetical protein [Rhodospirillales bacterium]
MSYGDLGVFSEDRVRTPNLDRLVAGGVCMQQHYSGLTGLPVLAHLG